MLNLKQHELTHSHRNVCCECCSVYICMGVWVCGCPCVSTSHLKGAKIWQQAAHTHHPRPYSITHFQQRPLPAPPCPFGLTNSVQISTEKLERVAAGRSCLKSFLNITARSEGRGSGVARLGGWGEWSLGLSGSESLRCLFVLRTFSAPMHTLQIHLVSLGCFVSLFLRLLFSWLSDLSSSSSLCCHLKFWVLISLSGYVHRVSITKNQYTTFTPQSRLNSHRFVQVNHQRRHFKLY